MKRQFRILLALLLCLTMALGSVPTALGEETDTAGEIDLMEVIADEAVDETPDAQPEDGEEANEEAPFERGYVRLVADAAVYGDVDGAAVLATVRAGERVLALGREETFLRVAFRAEDAVIEGYMAPEAAEPLNDEEINLYMDAAAAQEEVFLYQDDIDLPLLPVLCELPLAETAPEAEAAPEEEETVQAADLEAGEETGGLCEPTEIRLNYDSLTIGYREYSMLLKPSILPKECEELALQGVTWSSSDMSVVGVNALGHIYGADTGRATITATTDGGLTASCVVTVMEAPTRVTIVNAPATMAAGGVTRQLEYALPAGTASASMTYASTNTDVITIDANGMMTTHAPGEAYVAVAAYNSRWTSVKITVTEVPARLAFENTEIDLAESQSARLSVRATGASGAAVAADATYSVDPASPDPDCVRLDAATGEIQAIKKGQAIVRAVTPNGVEADQPCVVSVVGGPADMALNRTSLAIGLKEYYIGLEAVLMPPEGEKSCATDIAWRSSNTGVVQVNDLGHIYGSGIGVATVYARTSNGIERGCEITVGSTPTRISIVNAPAELSEGGMTCQLQSVLNAGAASGKLIYATSDPGIISIDENGLMTTGRAGEANIAVATYNSKWTAVRIRVTELPSSLRFEATEVSVAESQSGQVSATAYGASGKSVAGGVLYSVDPASPDPGCVQVDAETGAILGVRKGTALLRAKTFNGVEAAQPCTVSVLTAPADMQLNRSSVAIGLKEYYIGLEAKLIAPAGEADCAAQLSWRSSDTSVVAVNGLGHIYGVRTGTAYIYASTHNGIERGCLVTVRNAPTQISFVGLPQEMSEGGMTRQMQYAVNTGAASGAYTYASSDPSVIAVDENGLMTTGRPGEAIVAVATYNAKWTAARVRVVEAPKWVEFKEQEINLAAQQKATLTAQAYGASGAAVSAGLTYSIDTSSPDPDCVQLNAQTGEVTGVRKGRAYIAVTTHNGVGAEKLCVVNVAGAPAAVSLNTSSVTLGLKEYYMGLEALLTPPEGEEHCAAELTWRSSNPDVVGVNALGHIYGASTGAATVTVTTHNGLTASCTVRVVSAPSRVALYPVTDNVGMGESGHSLTAVVPSGSASAKLTYISGNTAVVTVDESGNLTPVAPGTAQVGVRTFNGQTAVSTVTVYPAPTYISAQTNLVSLGAGQSFALQVTQSAGSMARLSYTSSNPSVATVNADGVITAVGRGQSVITISTYLPEVYDRVYVSVLDAPSSVRLDPAALTLNVDDTYQLQPIIPENSMTVFTYATSNAAVATVSADGAVVAKGRGTAVITATAHNGQKAELQLTVNDPWFPEELQLISAPTSMKVGETYQVHYATMPMNARPELVWASSHPNIVAVDDQGLLTAKSYGSATIVAVSAKNGALRFSFLVGVQSDHLTLVIPARTTGTDGISANIARMEAVRKSAIWQIDELLSSGVISSSDASKRKSMVNNAFRDYEFPWMTPTYQDYWKAENSENGAKDFKPGIVYYGMPYTSGAMPTREYNAAKAVSERRYVDSGNGYYLLNQSRNYNKWYYYGNDCSSFTSIAIWGVNSGHASDNTHYIATSGNYKTVAGRNNMRPGDLICKEYAHVVMFLYYANAERTQIMIIENGGAEAGTNTVHCAVHDISWYINRGYSIRRLSSLGN